MFKKLMMGMALLTSFTACSDDYTDWLSPQTNPGEEMKTVALNVSPVSPVNLAEVTDDSVKVFSLELSKVETAAAAFEVELRAEAEGEAKTLKADEAGRVAVADLTDAIVAFYGKRPAARTMQATVNAYITEQGQAVRAQGFTEVTATPVAPVIEGAYYLIGSHNDWTPATVTDYRFSHSGLDVYDDPVFTLTVAAPVNKDTGERIDFWFNIVPESALSMSEADFWPSLIGSDTANGDDRAEAGLSVKVDGKDNAFVQYADDEAKFYQITLNMLDGRMTVKPLSFESYIYIPGNHQGWDPASAPRLYNAGGEGVYSGFAYLDGGFKFTKGPSWSDGEYNYGSFTTHPEGFTGEGGGDITCTAPAFYALTADIPAAALRAVPVSFGIIGNAQPGGWDTDTDMTYNRDEQCWEADVDLKADEYKFRANHDWAVNLGGTLDNLTQDGGNLRVAEAGRYTVKLYLNRTPGHDNLYATLTPASAAGSKRK